MFGSNGRPVYEAFLILNLIFGLDKKSKIHL